jgi:hypothetical protein
MLRNCDVRVQRVEVQEHSRRLLVSLDDAESQMATKMKCLDQEQEKFGVGFAVFSVVPDPAK